MNIKILVIGNIKNNNLQELITFFTNKINKFCKFEIIELKEVVNKSIVENIKEETLHLIKKINENYLDFEKILLDVNGKLVSSTFFADIIANNKNYKSGKILFIIGGSNGLNNLINNYLTSSISFGKITFPHQMFRLILVEQIYRAFKIIRNEKYHK